MTWRRVLAAAATGLWLVVATAGCSQDPVESARPDGPGGASDVAGDAEPMCRRVSAELTRRDDAGDIDWEAAEGSEEEPTDAELESVVIAREPFPGDVATGEERPVFPDFPDQPDIAALTDAELVQAVDTCYEIGVLADEGPDD